MKRSLICLALLVAFVVTVALPAEVVAKKGQVLNQVSSIDQDTSRADKRSARKARRAAARSIAQKSDSDDEIVAWMHSVNEQLEAAGLNIAVEQIEYFTIGQGRPANRIHQQPFRWVAGDPRRGAQGNDITYIVDQSGAGTSSGVSSTDTEAAADRAMTTWDGTKCLKKVSVAKRADPGNDITYIVDQSCAGTTSGVPAADTEAAADRAMTTWDGTKCLKKVSVAKRADPGSDITIFDFFLGAGGFGNPFAADIVDAGFFPPGPPFFGPNTLAFSVTFIFTSGGSPTDINGDNRLDTALNEVYWNDGFNWGDPQAPLPQVDVETVAFHEFGHSLGVGHFGPPPSAVMNPVYSGPRTTPAPIDKSGMCTVWSSWPK